MLIAHVLFSVAPQERDAALSHLLTEAASVRARPGCRMFLPFAHPSDPGRLGVIHEWEDAAGFEGYTASDGFAATGAALRPMMVAPPDSRRFAAELLEVVR